MGSQPAKPRVAIDTNLFVSGTIIPRGNPFELLEAWRHGSFLLVTSPEQRVELEATLRKPVFGRKYGLSNAGIASVLRRVDGDSIQVSAPRSLPVAVRDASDEMILAGALEGRADYLVTGDGDLLELNGHPDLGTLQIVTARAFLAALARI